MQIRKTILHQHANHHTSVCVRDENKVSQWDEERKNYTSNFKKRNRHRRTAHVVLRENPMFDRRDLKLSPLFSIWILSDVTVDASTKKNTHVHTQCALSRDLFPPERKQKEKGESRPIRVSVSKMGSRHGEKKGDKWRKLRDGRRFLILQSVFC